MTKPEKQKRTRLDWEAIERDWRTGQFTLRELADKHSTDAATISRRQKADRATDPARWQKDLSAVVRQATNAALMTEMVNSKINEGQQQVNNVVFAAAQANAEVVLRHRGDALTARTLAMDMLHELKLATHSQDELQGLLAMAGAELNADGINALQRSFDDLMRLHNRVGSVQKLADTLTKLQNLERKAFGLDDEDPAAAAGNGRELSDVERASRVASILDRARARKAAGGEPA